MRKGTPRPLRPASDLYARRARRTGIYRQRGCLAAKGASRGHGKSRGAGGYGLLANTLNRRVVDMSNVSRLILQEVVRNSSLFFERDTYVTIGCGIIKETSLVIV